MSTNTLRGPQRSGVAAPSHPSARRRPSALAELTSGVEWTPGFIAFLYYLVAVISFRLKGADVAAVACLSAIVLQPAQIRLAVPLRWLAALLAWSALTVAASQYRALSFESWTNFGKVLLIAFAAHNVNRSERQLRFTLAVAVFTFLMFPFRGAITNYVFGHALFGRAIWNYVYANPNDMAAFALLFASMATGLSFLCRSRILRSGALLVAVGFAVLVFLTQSRGAIVGMGLAAVVIFAGSKKRLQIFVGGVAVMIAAAIFAPSSMWDRLGGLANVSASGGMRNVDAEGSAEQRFQIAKVALAIVRDNPLFGVGIGAYAEAHARYAAERRAELPIAGGKRDAHNTWLRVTAELGAIGALLFSSILLTTAMAVRTGLRNSRLPSSQREALRWLGLGLLAFCFAGTFGSFGYLNMLYLQIVFIVVLASESKSLATVRVGPRPQNVNAKTPRVLL